MKLVLGDDQAIFLDALATVLTQHGYEIAAVARSPEEMVAQVRHQLPDACLIDCNVAVDDGIDTIRATVEASRNTTVVVLSADAEPKSVDRALEAGASAYLHQSRGVEVLVDALKRAIDGEQVVDLPDGSIVPPRRATHADNLAAGLTGRERECLSLLVAGLDTAGMMQRLGVSRTTVRTHLQAVLTKLCVHSRLEAASFAVRHHLVEAWEEEPAAAASGGDATATGTTGTSAAGAGMTGAGRTGAGMTGAGMTGAGMTGAVTAARPGTAARVTAGRSATAAGQGRRRRDMHVVGRRRRPASSRSAPATPAQAPARPAPPARTGQPAWRNPADLAASG